MSNLAPESIHRRNLPHIQPPGGTFFITFRLVGSIPMDQMAELCAEADRVWSGLHRQPSTADRARRMDREHRRFFGRWDAALDNGPGPGLLRQAAVAGLVAENIRRHAGIRYDMMAYCIMPNHVHVVLSPLLQANGEYWGLARILHTMKGFTANRANRLLARSGAFWQHESYDQCVRSAPELGRIVQYVIRNPVRAGLVECWRDWPWSYWCAEP